MVWRIAVCCALLSLAVHAQVETQDPPPLVVLAPAPLTSFDLGPQMGVAPLRVFFVDRTTGPVERWSWTFGDGSSSSARNPNHLYREPGSYDVTLIAEGPGGSARFTRRACVEVRHARPRAKLSFEPATGVVPLVVSFADSSAGEVTSRSWDFGDGTGSDHGHPTHVYTEPGTFTVALSVNGPGGNDVHVREKCVRVAHPPPRPDFTVTPETGTAPLTVAFEDVSAGVVTSRAWDFATGELRHEAALAHTFTLPGLHTVSLRVTGPGGERTVEYDVIVREPPPVAYFLGTPSAGPAPLTVGFENLSTGHVEAWSWDFGDGAGSDQREPVHTFTDPGTYSVTLTVHGAGGSNAVRQDDSIAVAATSAPGLRDPGFEEQVPGFEPREPWGVVGRDHLIHPASVREDEDFPTEGWVWLELNAGASRHAEPPSSPLDRTAPAFGGQGTSQRFRIPPGRPILRFEAAFLRNGEPESVVDNDWMSVEVSDGSTTYSVYYKDSFSPTPLVSEYYGFPMTPAETVTVDLRSLYPGASENTVFELSVLVGNGGEDPHASRGYVDGFRFEASAEALVRNGAEINPLCYSSTSLPALGTTWTAEIDTSSVTGRCVSFVLGYDAALPGLVLPYGELLVAPPALGGNFLLAHVATPSGGVAHHANPVPGDLQLAGLAVYTQGVILGREARLCNAIDLRLGH